MIFGGVPIGRQIRAVANGIDVVVATPGRLLDLLDQRALTLNEVELFVLDEADRMLDMGFVRDIKRILPSCRSAARRMFFSATMPKEIADLAGSMLTKPVQVAVTPVASTVDRIAQQHHLLPDAAEAGRAAQAARGSRRSSGPWCSPAPSTAPTAIVKHLTAAGIPADAIHGNKSQGQRERAMAAFRSGRRGC